MAYFKVVESYPQAVVRRVMIVTASSAEEARHDPHVGLLSSALNVDEGGEAITEEVVALDVKGMTRAMDEVSKARLLCQ